MSSVLRFLKILWNDLWWNFTFTLWCASEFLNAVRQVFFHYYKVRMCKEVLTTFSIDVFLKGLNTETSRTVTVIALRLYYKQMHTSFSCSLYRFKSYMCNMEEHVHCRGMIEGVVLKRSRKRVELDQTVWDDLYSIRCEHSDRISFDIFYLLNSHSKSLTRGLQTSAITLVVADLLDKIKHGLVPTPAITLCGVWSRITCEVYYWNRICPTYFQVFQLSLSKVFIKSFVLLFRSLFGLHHFF